MTDGTLHHLVTTIGIDLGKNSCHLIGMDKRGKILGRQKLVRGQLEERLANRPPGLIGLEACAGAHQVGRRLAALGHGWKRRFQPPDPGAAREAVPQGPQERLSRCRSDRRGHAAADHGRERCSRLSHSRAASSSSCRPCTACAAGWSASARRMINQIQGFLLEHGIVVRQGAARLRQALPTILAQRGDVLTPRLVHLLEDLSGDWRQLDTRLEAITTEIEELARQDASCRRLMGIPGVGPLVASAMVAAIGNGAALARGRDFGAWLGLVPKQIATGDRTILGGPSKRGNRYLHP